MLFPTISDYKNALVMPESFATLGSLRPEKGLFDDVYFSSGNFAVVFKMRDTKTGKLHAVKCFTREQDRRVESLESISDYLEAVKSPYLVPYTFLKDEIWVNNADYPVLLMDWVDGVTLGEKVKALCDKRNTEGLHRLTIAFAEMALWLLEQDWAHGDLKHDNIIVRPDDTLALVDYDGCFVPSMSGQNAREIGSPCYRHPKRTAQHFDRHIDDFSVLVIFLSLRALTLKPNWFDSYQNGENLLFSVNDLTEPLNSSLIPDMKETKDDILNSSLALLEYVLSSQMSKVFGLSNLIKKTLGIDFLILFKDIQTKKWGCSNSTEDIIIPCIYDKRFYFDKKTNFAAVIKDGKMGFINTAGQEVIPCIYDEINTFRLEPLLKVCRDGKYGIFSQYCIEIIPCDYEDIEYVDYKDKLLLKVKKENKFGIYSIHGQLVNKCINDSVKLMGDKLIKIERENKFGVIDKYGHELCTCIYSHINVINTRKKTKSNQEKAVENISF